MTQKYILKIQGLRNVIQNMKENFPDGIWMAKVSKIEYKKKKTQLHQNEKLSLLKKKKNRQTSGKEKVKMWKC